MEKRKQNQKFTNKFKNYIKKSFFLRRQDVIKRTKTDSVRKPDFKVNNYLLLGFYRIDAMFRRCVKVTTDYTVADGYQTYPVDEEDQESINQKEILDEFLERVDWNQQLRNISDNLEIYDDCFQEIVPGQEYPVDSVILNTPEIEIKFNKTTGEIDRYAQVEKGSDEEISKIDPDRVIHYRLNVLGDNAYGISDAETTLFSIATKRFAELGAGRRFEKQKARGFWHFKGWGDKDYNEAVEEIKKAKNDPQRDLYLLSENPEATVEYNDLIKGEDMQFIQLLAYLRQQIITGLGVPPILLGIPEGSNRASADIEMQSFDRKIRARQTAIEHYVNQKLIKEKFGFDKVKFKLKRINKRDEVREVDIANKLINFVSLNDIREKLGYPRIEEEWADEVPAVAESPQELTTIQDLLQNRDDKSFGKSEEFEKKMNRGEGFAKENPTTKSDEQRFASIIKGWLNDTRKAIRKELKSNEEVFRREITDPKKLVEKITSTIAVAKLRSALSQEITRLVGKGNKKAGTELGVDVGVDSETLKFIDNYTYGLVEGVNTDLKNKLSQTLRRGVMEGQSIPIISKNISNDFKISSRRAENIARTETSRAVNTGKSQVYKKVGVEKVKWVASIDDRTSDICRKLNGQEIPISGKFKAMDWEGTNPPAHPGCRSTIVAVE